VLSHPVAIALGSNVGRREAHLNYAVNRLGGVLTSMRVSSFVDTEPVGVEPQPRFLNGVVVGEIAWSPWALLEWLLRIEVERGRIRTHPGAPRTLDLDLILYGDVVMDEPGLVIPHPRFRTREFVLAPLSEVAPEMIDPLTKLTACELLAAIRS
jgi:2-amino-4-hydroxy-6-hydroxymethyldihydropteridine diphosphokinase